MKKPFKNINKIIDFLQLDKKNQKRILKNSDFKFLLPYRLAEKINKNDLNDPIFRQFIPLEEEEKKKSKDFSLDPLLEEKFQKGKFLKKYPDRALLICSNTCGMNCRFCFRRYYKNIKDKNFKKEIEIIKKDKTLEEIILSGGDPLSLKNNELLDLLNKLNAISHIKRIRFHTRYILAYPERINFEFLKILKNIKKQIIFVFHINHPKEIDEDIIFSIQKLKNLKFLLFNQGVLLKGVNDNLKTLKTLNETLIKIGIIPYYIHQLDKIKGTSHFEVDINKGKKLIKSLSENTSGYICPKYVQEIANKKSKTVL